MDHLFHQNFTGIIRRNQTKVYPGSRFTFSINRCYSPHPTECFLGSRIAFSTKISSAIERRSSPTPASFFPPKFFFAPERRSSPAPGPPSVKPLTGKGYFADIVFHKKSHSSRFSSQAGKFILRFLGPSFLCILQVREFQWKNRVESFPRSQF